MEVSISVALCTYNGARFLAQQIDSILCQTVQPVEIVVGDDGSTDETLDILARYGSSVTLLPRHGNLGVTGNFQRTIGACSGSLIALSDQDDVWVPTKLERLRDRFAANPNLRLVGSNAVAIDENDAPMGFDLFGAIALTAWERRSIDGHSPFDALIKRSLFTGATMMVRRDLLEDAVPFPSWWLHDEWLAIIAAATGEVDLLDEKLIFYRQHQSNVAGVQENNLARRLRSAKKLISPRVSRHQTLLARREVLHAQLSKISARPGAVGKAQEALRHERYRSSLPRARALRLAPVWREYRSGRYDSVDYGGREILRDLLASPR
ncbi:glycosyltransferase family 2 protein [uncultured Microbacterium sp.]|uniref:glycosyltransferase family 2 protein n=1 Tax=uncultured Microbacterium sp. TaxID=191216 RepID=UPI0025FE941A|nr:glycosyltransferase family 2 protein [uncultured Microbacterium sp.]